MKAQEPKIISVENMSKKFDIYERHGFFKRKKMELNVVKNLSFSVNKGDIVGFLGPNGAGKSTTIKMLTGILTPNDGECFVNNIKPYKNRKQNAKNIGVVFGQRTQLWWDLTVEDNLTLLKEMYQVNEEKFIDRLNFLDSILGVEKLMYKQIRMLSLGQRMRVDIAASLLHSPSILFLDEPTIGLDVVVKENILEILKIINAQDDLTIILTTHDMADVEKLCNRAIIINDGEKIFDDKITTLKDYYGRFKRILLSLKINENIKKTFYGLKEEGKIISVKFDSEDQVDIKINQEFEKEILLILFRDFDIDKVEISEPPISDIVKKIYEKKRIGELIE